MSKTFVFYHGNCPDGTAAAWAVFDTRRTDDSFEYVPCNYGDAEWRKHDIAGATVLFVDFSEPKEAILEICQLAASVLILDHHKTAQAALGDPSWHPANLKVVFDMDRSGAQITWDHFHPGQPQPALISYIGDRDLWKFALPHSRAVSAFVWLYQKNIAEFESCHQQLEEDLAACVEKGKMVSMTLGCQARSSAEKLAVRTDKDGNRYGFGNVTTNISDTADVFLHSVQPDAVYCLTYFDIPTENKRVFSLRSRKGFDVSVLAKRFPGGGGHAQAAGFTVHPGFIFPTED